jgi:asparagine synthase (glutamine-hydrolysing)
MAGIVGIADGNQEQLIKKALATVAHRGGAGAHVRCYDHATLGEAWPAAQEPYAIGIDRQSVVTDGETYNWTELDVVATSPIEALETAYWSLGPDFVAQLHGHFAIAIADHDGVFLARDLLGRSPLYYGRHQGHLCFASEIKALLGWAEEIAEFPPGHYYDASRGLVRFARLETRPTLELPPQEIAAQLLHRLVVSVRKRLSDGEVGAWLSGGLDSATMTALARRQVPRLHTFAAGIEGAPDLQYARAVADFVGTQHHERVCTADEMLAILPEAIYHLESFDALLVRSSIMNFLAGRLSSQHVHAVLSGEGGDELFAGYEYLKQLDLADLPEELIDITQRLCNTALQRVDRCSASHGIVARTGFLDRDVVEYALQIPAEMKLGGEDADVEKWILRVAMDGLLPDGVLTRPKAKFWEGAGVGDLLASHANDVISDSEFESARTLPDGSKLRSKEELYYYRIFRDEFGSRIDPALVGRTKRVPATQ